MSRRGPPPDISRMVSLKVDGLSHRTSLDDIERLFEKYGRVGDVYIPKDYKTRENRGFGFVRYFKRRDAEDAIESLDGRKFDGRELSVQYARYDRPEREYRPPPRRARSRSRSRSRRRDRSRSRRRGSRSRSGRRSRSRRSRSRSKDKRDRSRSRSRSGSAKSDDDRKRRKRRDSDKSDDSRHDKKSRHESDKSDDD